MENFVNILVTNNDLEEIMESKIASRRLYTFLSYIIKTYYAN